MSEPRARYIEGHWYLPVEDYHELQASLAQCQAERDALKGELFEVMARDVINLQVNDGQWRPYIEDHIQSIIDNAKPKEN